MMRKTGYFCGTSIHAVRRYVGKKIDGKSRSSIQPLVFVPFFLKTGSIRMQIGCADSQRLILPKSETAHSDASVRP